MIDVVRQEGAAADREIPPVVLLGSDAYTLVKGVLEGVHERVESWKEVTCGTDLSR